MIGRQKGGFENVSDTYINSSSDADLLLPTDALHGGSGAAAPAIAQLSTSESDRELLLRTPGPPDPEREADSAPLQSEVRYEELRAIISEQPGRFLVVLGFATALLIVSRDE